MKKNILLKGLSVLFLYYALTFYIGYNVYVYVKTVTGDLSVWVVVSLLAILSHSYFFGRFVHLSSFFKIVGSYWIALFQYSLVILPFLNGFVWLFDGSIPLAGGIFLLFIFFLFSIGTYNAYHTVVRMHKVKINGKGKEPSLRIVLASDMHFGTLSGKRHAERLTKKINEQNADLVIFAGDIVDDDPKPFIAKNMGGCFDEIQSKHGIYGVLGNHDYYGREVPLLLSEMKKRGVNMLLDEVVEFNGISIIGRKDYSDKTRKNLESLMNETAPDTVKILIDHQPHEIDLSSDLGIHITLSGHTHRGQMAPNHLITKRIFDLDYGHREKNGMHAFVSSGFGFWGPAIRIGSRSEIFVIDVSFE